MQKAFVNGNLMHKEKQRLVFEVQRRTAIIHGGTKESETIQWPKLWQFIVTVSLRIKNFLNNYSGMAWLKTLRNPLKFVKVGGEQILTFLPIKKTTRWSQLWTFCDRLRRRNSWWMLSFRSSIDVNKMRENLITCLEMQRLTQFPKVSNQYIYILTLFAIKFLPIF